MTQVAHAIEADLKRVPGTREVIRWSDATHGARIAQSGKPEAYQLTMQDIRAALQSANVSQNSGTLVQSNREVLVQTGSFLSDAMK